MDPNERDNWLDDELLNNNNNYNTNYNQQLGGSFTGNPKIDMNSSQLQIKNNNNKDYSNNN